MQILMMDSLDFRLSLPQHCLTLGDGGSEAAHDRRALLACQLPLFSDRWVERHKSRPPDVACFEHLPPHVVARVYPISTRIRRRLRSRKRLPASPHYPQTAVRATDSIHPH